MFCLELSVGPLTDKRLIEGIEEGALINLRQSLLRDREEQIVTTELAALRDTFEQGRVALRPPGMQLEQLIARRLDATSNDRNT